MLVTVGCANEFLRSLVSGEILRSSCEELRKFCGTPTVGWLGPDGRHWNKEMRTVSPYARSRNGVHVLQVSVQTLRQAEILLIACRKSASTTIPERTDNNSAAVVVGQKFGSCATVGHYCHYGAVEGYCHCSVVEGYCHWFSRGLPSRWCSRGLLPRCCSRGLLSRWCGT